MRRGYDRNGERPPEIFPVNLYFDGTWKATGGRLLQPIDAVVIHDWSIAHNLLLNALSHFPTLNGSEASIESDDTQGSDFDSEARFLTRLALHALIKVLETATTLIAALCCFAFGLFIIEDEVPRQPDLKMAARLFWSGCGLIVLGQGFILAGLYFTGFWF